MLCGLDGPFQHVGECKEVAGAGTSLFVRDGFMRCVVGMYICVVVPSRCCSSVCLPCHLVPS